MDDFTGQRVTVMGLGRFGGGVGVSRYLARRGAEVLVTDAATAGSLRDSVSQLDGFSNIGFRLGEHDTNDFTDADLVVANPAVEPESNLYLQAARDAGVPITSEIRLLVGQLPSRRRVIGVTGSAGKSTVTAMLGRVLRNRSKTDDSLEHTPEPNVWLGGNLGGSLLEQVDQISANDWVVLELSSFMLHGLANDRWSPGIAVVTNLSPNHLDWHGSYERYVRAKQHILDFQTDHDLAVLGPGVRPLVYPGHARTIGVTQPWEGFGKLAVPGEHNRLNATLVMHLADSLHLSRDQSVEALRSFGGLPHRLQRVAEHAGVRFYNDSKSTTPEAAVRAIHAFAPRDVHVILGGYDKGMDLTPLGHAAAEHCRAIYTLGQTGGQIADLAQAALDQIGKPRPQASSDCQIVRCHELDQAVHAAAKSSSRGEVVLLSPGCASWDQFDHYEQRGQRFTALVHAMKADPPRGHGH